VVLTMRPRCWAMLGVDQVSPARLELSERSLLVRPHQARIASNIGGNDRGELEFGLRRSERA
jgi:hypothetical protein